MQMMITEGSELSLAAVLAIDPESPIPIVHVDDLLRGTDGG
jgi:hypothetical protein